MANTNAPTWAIRRVELLVAMLREPAVQSIFADLKATLLAIDKQLPALEDDEAARGAAELARIQLRLSGGTERLILHLGYLEELAINKAIKLVEPPFVALSFYDRSVIPASSWRDFASWRRQVASYFDRLSFIRMVRHYSEGDVWIRVEPDTSKTELLEFVDTYYADFEKHFTPTPLFDIHSPKLLDKKKRIKPVGRELTKLNRRIVELIGGHTSYEIAEILSGEGFTITADSVRRVVGRHQKTRAQQFRIV